MEVVRLPIRNWRNSRTVRIFGDVNLKSYFYVDMWIPFLLLSDTAKMFCCMVESLDLCLEDVDERFRRRFWISVFFETFYFE